VIKTRRSGIYLASQPASQRGVSGRNLTSFLSPKPEEKEERREAAAGKRQSGTERGQKEKRAAASFELYQIDVLSSL
jgi:hypothetical protein